MSRAKSAATLEEGGQGTLEIDIPDAALQMDIKYIAWESIKPDPLQPRVEADAELRASIAQGGIRQPITVRLNPEKLGEYLIVDGERRWRGAEGVQDRIPCVVRQDLEEDTTRLRDQLVANTGKPLTPVEEARSYQKLIEKLGSPTAVAKFVGKPITTVSQRLNLLLLGPWLELIQSGVIKYTHAAEALLPYRGCPDGVHNAVIESLGDQLTPAPGDESAFPNAEELGYAVRDAYKKHLYPISKAKYDVRPEFDVTKHDAECTCGGVLLKNYDGQRRHCGNPEWWEPREKEAKKAQRAKEKAKASKKSSTSGAAAASPPAEDKWQREQRLRRAESARIAAAATQLREAFAKAIRKMSPKPGGFLEQEIRLDFGKGSKGAMKLVPRGTSGDDLIRSLVFDRIYDEVEGNYVSPERVRALGKACGVDVNAIVDKVSPIVKEKPAADKAAVKPAPKAKAAPAKAKRKPNAPFMKPVTPNEKLAVVVGATPLPKTELTKKLWAYIKKHGLQDKKNRRMINADTALTAVFGGKKQVSMFDMTKLVAKNLK